MSNVFEFNSDFNESSSFEVIYFESHITIEPVFEEDLLKVKTLAETFKFKVADLLMKKRNSDKPERSQYDTFLTGRNKSYKKLEESMNFCAACLIVNGFKVWRKKIEAVIYDERTKPNEGLINV